MARRKLGLALDRTVVQDNNPVLIVPGVYLGSIYVSYNEEGMRRAGITHVLNVSGFPPSFPHVFTYLNVRLRDKDFSNLLGVIPAALLFIGSAVRSGGAVLVHCAGGRSRSPGLIVAYLITRHAMAFEAAISHVRSCRSVVSLNAGFEQQLRAFDECGGDVYAAHQLVLRTRLAQLESDRGACRRRPRRLHPRLSPCVHSPLPQSPAGTCRGARPAPPPRRPPSPSTRGTRTSPCRARARRGA